MRRKLRLQGGKTPILSRKEQFEMQKFKRWIEGGERKRERKRNGVR